MDALFRRIVAAPVLLIAAGCSDLPAPAPAPLVPAARPDSALVPPGAPPAEPASEGTLVLSLEKCLELALGGSHRIRIARLGPAQRAEDFFIAGEVFAPQAFIEAAHDARLSPAVSRLSGAPVLRETGSGVRAGVTKTWLTGTRTDLVWAYGRRETNSSFFTINPRYESSIGIELTQPLLHGFGAAVNRVALDRAVNDRRIADAAFEIVLETELLRTYRAYWDLLLAAEGSAIEESSLALAREQTAIARDRLDAGAAARLEVTSAEAAEARQEEAVIASAAAYRKAGDRLLLLIRPSSRAEEYRGQIIPSTRPDLGEPLEEALAEADAVREALERRAEIRLESIRIENVDLDLLLAEDARRPDLEGFGRFAYRDLEPKAGRAGAGETEFPDWAAGMRLTFFFDAEGRRARWRQVMGEKREAELRRDAAAAEITVEVRAARTDLESAVQRWRATRRTLDLAREQHEGELDRLRAGRSTQFQVESHRRDRLDAERNALAAQAGVYLARAVFEAVQGRLASRFVETAEPLR